MIFTSLRNMVGKRDLVHLNRLRCFNDVVFAIVATILILPIRRLLVTADTDLKAELEDVGFDWLSTSLRFLSFAPYGNHTCIGS